MTRPHPPIRRRGIALLFTLVVLMVLATAIVSFQADTALNNRAAAHRLEKLQCRYAAESGIVAGSEMVKQRLIENVLARRANEALTGSNLNNSEQGLDGWMESMSWSSPDPDSDDPNATVQSDPNAWFKAGTQDPHFVLLRERMTVGQATVDIEIHDENAKWPVSWILSPPYEKSASRWNQRSLGVLAESLEVDPGLAGDIFEMTNRLGGPLRVPPPEFTYYTSSEEDDTRQRQSRRSRRYRRRRYASRRRLSYRNRLAERERRHYKMGIFAKLWNQEITEDPDWLPLRDRFWDSPYAFKDYLGVWGSYYVNVNSASVEMLESAFSAFGMTREIAEVIVARAKEKEYTNFNQVLEVASMPSRLENAMRQLTTTRPQVYSVYVTAQLGRSRIQLQTGLFVHQRRIKNLVVVPGGIDPPSNQMIHSEADHLARQL